MAGPAWMRVPKTQPAVAAGDGGPGSTVSVPIPCLGGSDVAQFFGLAASIAARLTIWLISLACSASERICVCT
jgi:hypothetical protein